MAKRPELGEDCAGAGGARPRASARGCAPPRSRTPRPGRCDLLVPVPDDAPSEGPHVYNMGPSKYEKREASDVTVLWSGVDTAGSLIPGSLSRELVEELGSEAKSRPQAND